MPNIDYKNIPKHIAIIMDGNGRWAKKKTLKRVFGHEEGTKSVREIVRAGREIGVSWLTLYAFSEENWIRPKYEIKALMQILKRFLKSELQEMMDNNIRFQTIGRIHKMPDDVRKAIRKTKDETAKNDGMVLNLALSYGSRQEILDCVKDIAKKIENNEINSNEVDDQLIANSLYTAGMPDPDLLIRTSGEYRISNFLLWQIAYTEIYITRTLWPDFRKRDFLKAIESFQNRERRFGATGDQVTSKRRK